MGPESIVTKLGQYVHGLNYDSLPPDVVELAKTRIMNHLAVSLQATDLPASVVAWETIKDNKGPCTILGHPERVPAQDAALYNSVTGHQSMQEDVGSGGHPGMIIVPASLAAGEESRADGKQILTAIVVGYEINSRVGRGLTEHNRRSGFRSVSLQGVFGAAAAAAKLSNLNPEQTAHALGFASILASGVYQGFAEGTMDPFYEGGFASRNGILAALIARNGGKSASLALEGANGYLRAYTGSLERVDEVTKGLGQTFDIRGIQTKPYATSSTNNQPTHLAVTLSPHIGGSKEVKYAVLRVSDHTRATAGKDNLPPFSNMTMASMSLRFCVAAGLLRKPLTSLHFFKHHYDDPEVWELANRIQVVGEAGRKVAALEVHLEDGRSLALQEENSQIFETKTEKVRALFDMYAEGVLDSKRSSQIADTIMHMEQVKDINDFTALLQLAAPRTGGSKG